MSPFPCPDFHLPGQNSAGFGHNCAYFPKFPGLRGRRQRSGGNPTRATSVLSKDATFELRGSSMREEARRGDIWGPDAVLSTPRRTSPALIFKAADTLFPGRKVPAPFFCWRRNAASQSPDSEILWPRNTYFRLRLYRFRNPTVYRRAGRKQHIYVGEIGGLQPPPRGS